MMQRPADPQPQSALERFCHRIELPTWLVVIAIYGGWLALTWYYHAIPWYVMLVLAPIVIAWHGSLRHEACHGHPISRNIAAMVAAPPLNLIEPFPLYRKFHLEHHINPQLTIPVVDTESYYFSQESWDAMSPFKRKVRTFYQTYSGRMLLGPGLYFYSFFKTEMGALLRGEMAHGKIWLVQAFWMAAVLYWILAICHIPFWQYFVIFTYLGNSLGMTRSFYEHRYDKEPLARCVVVEKSPFFQYLFLNNNYHAVHHEKPHLPWYTLDDLYWANRDYYRTANNNYIVESYGRLIREHLFKPVFHPVHPGDLPLQSKKE